MYAKEVMGLTEEQLLEQLRISSSPGAMDYELCERELNRRYMLRLEAAVNRVDASSKRLERLTLALIALTIFLAVLAAPLAFEAVAKLISSQTTTSRSDESEADQPRSERESSPWSSASG